MHQQPHRITRPEEGPGIRVAIVEDQPLFRGMLTGLLNSQPSIRVVASVESVTEARKVIRPGSVDVAVLDVELGDGNGVALGVSLRRADPRIRILLLSSYDVLDLLLDLPPDVREGWSYLSKTSSTSMATLVGALRETARGRTVLDPALVAKSVPRAGSLVATLTPRQYEVLQLVAQGLSNGGIAEKLHLSEKSVQNHLNAVYSALDIPQESARNPRVTAVLRLLEETSREGR